MSKDSVKTQNRVLLKPAMHKEKTRTSFYAEYYPQIKRYIAPRINSSTDAEDLAQDVFIEFWKGNSPQDPKTYIFAIARKIVAQYCRNKKKQPQTVQISLVGEIAASRGLRQSQNMVKQISLRELTKIIEEAAVQLPPKAYEAIKLRFIEGLCSKEAAQRAGCSIDAFWKRLQRAGRMLRQIREKRAIGRG